MAFKDITKVLYNGEIKLDYKDGNHTYYARPRINFDLPVDNPKAWGKTLKGIKGTTTLLKETLEKGGLMNYSLTKALMDLFAFYEFTTDDGEKKMGYSSKGIGRLWGKDGKLIPYTKEEALEIISFGSKSSVRHTQKGADVGSVVHDAIEHFVRANPNTDPKAEIVPSGFDIAEQYMWSIKNAEYETEQLKDLALEEFPADVAAAEAAFNQFVIWWKENRPELLGAEDLIYSKEHNISGTFDGLIKIGDKIILADWKTSNASTGKGACSPNGAYYDYFIQSAIYAMAWEEMGNGLVDDLAIVSCRKDGNFDVTYASDLGFTVADCIAYAKFVIGCYKYRTRMREALWEHGIKTGRVTATKKGAK